MITAYHARYQALELRRRGLAEAVDAVGTALFDARVDLNPHQIEAALFGLRTSAEQGRLLADEVGLGKTIEAALVLCQLWAERRRRLLVVCPASLRRQWVDELETKFGLPARILDGRGPADLTAPSVHVVSYQWGIRNAARIAEASCDLVVLDEAHRLRNAWKSEARGMGLLVAALQGAPKLLLTATPLQNSLLELYGLVSLLDAQAFGDPNAFREHFMRGDPDLVELRSRLEPVCHRTLRRAVLPYVRYTARRSVTSRFTASPAEQRLYADVSEFLARDDLECLPRAQRGLVTMVLRKLLASSSAAIASALKTIRARVAVATTEPVDETWTDEGFDAEWLEATDETANEPASSVPAAEIAELDRLIAAAEQVGTDRRAFALLDALRTGFDEMRRLGAPAKAVVFTESRLTQDFLAAFLAEHGYAGRIVLFNGTNAGPEARAILEAWQTRHPDAATTASRAANMRAALVEHFRDHADVLIATEAGAEGLNLQFCALVVNYDLPWNPQRVEQRIGRCHRYGQVHDVVVVNFLDESNAAERRVLELLTEKLRLFDGLFGASDEVLGALDSGVSLELRLHRIFQTCRTPETIATAFAALRAELDDVIRAREQRARQALLDHFDADVHDRLNVQLDAARARMDRVGRLFWSLTRWALDGAADFDDAALRFVLRRSPAADVPPGTYELVRREGNDVAEAFVYRLSSRLGEHVLDAGAAAPTPIARVRFLAGATGRRFSMLEALRGQSGWLRLERLRVVGAAVEQPLLFSGRTDDGASVDAETLEKMFDIDGLVEPCAPPAGALVAALDEAAARLRTATLAEASERNHAEYREAQARLERWARDQILGAEVAIKEIRRELMELERRARQAPTLEEAREVQARIAEVEARQRRARTRVFAVEDEVRARRNELLDELDRRMAQRSEAEVVFDLAWTVE